MNEYNNDTVRVLNEKIEYAFIRGLIAVILSEMPIGSIISIVFGKEAMDISTFVSNESIRLNVSISGKNIVANILSVIGYVIGIIMTVFWSIAAVALVVLIITLVTQTCVI